MRAVAGVVPGNSVGKGAGARKYDRNRKSAQNMVYKAEHRHEMEKGRGAVGADQRHAAVEAEIGDG